jgi:predicted DNA-binding protein (MmcQ/YjbR family)
MDIEEIRAYCLSKKGVTECLPFSDTALVFKVGDKMFALLDISDDQRGISLKCDPDLAIELRERHAEVTPAYHFNKKHWNGVDLSGNVSPEQVRQWIDHAYSITVLKLTRKLKEALELS